MAHSERFLEPAAKLGGARGGTSSTSIARNTSSAVHGDEPGQVQAVS